MHLDPAQKATLKANITAKQVAGQPLAGVTDEQAIANFYNAASAFFVWRTNVTKAEIYHSTSVDGTTWDWNIFKAQSVPEQGAWAQMFSGESGNFSLLNFRIGIEKIFGLVNAQTTHCKAVGKRVCLRLEALFATGTGTSAVPGLLVVEGAINAQEVANVIGGV